MRRLIRNAIRAPGRMAYAFAQSEAGAWLAATVVRRAPWALPARRLATTEAAVAFRHPRPEVRDHVVVVPRKRVRDLAMLHARGDEGALASMIRAAEAAARALPAAERVFTVNVGVRLDVAQLHGHLLPVPAARNLLAEAGPAFEVPCDDTGALRAALERVMARLEGGAAHVDGSLVVTGLGQEAWGLAASVAPTARRA